MPSRSNGYNKLVSTALIAGIDSAIGEIIANSLINDAWQVMGTSRRDVTVRNNNSFFCDFSDSDSIDKCASTIIHKSLKIDLLVVAVGLLEPIGKYRDIDFEQWEKGFYVNCIGPLRLINKLLPCLRNQKNSMVLTFAGGGINSSPERYSSYTLSKVALTKSMELLSTEEPEIRFVSLGTGWINTPIHNQTVSAGELAGVVGPETNRRIQSNDFVDINEISKFVAWAYKEAPHVISGRNFSLKNDRWSSSELNEKLQKDSDMYKLRRYGNDQKI